MVFHETRIIYFGIGTIFFDNICTFDRACLLCWPTVVFLALFKHIYQMPIQYEVSVTILEVVSSRLYVTVMLNLISKPDGRMPGLLMCIVCCRLWCLPSVVHKCFWWKMNPEDVAYHIKMTQEQ